jgi:4-amino-4-deoxy-L-arabinose transferase-like glycosyltransferase
VTDKQQMRAALLVILAIGLALRVVGLRYGLPAVYNPDEVAIMARALSFAKGSLNPHNFLYPTLYFYVLFVWVGTYLGYLWLTGRAASIAALQYLYFTDRTSIYTAGRSLGVAAGTATIVVLHWLATRLWDARTGIAAAVFLATAPLHVRDSHYVKHDVPVTLAIVAAYVAFVRIWPCARMEGPNLRDSIVAGAACGVAFSTHYYSIFLTLPLAWTIYHGFRSRGASVIASHLIAAAAASAAMFFALSPFIALEPLIAWRDVVANREIVVDRAVAAGAFAPALRYAEMLLWDSTGLPVLVLGVIGAVRVAIATPARAIQLLAFPLPFLIFIANTAPASRYLNPVLPFVACFAGWSIAWLTARATPAVFWAAVIATAAPGLLASIRADMFFRQTDTRTLAQSYIESHIASGSTIAIQPYSVQLTPSREGLVEALTRNLGSAAAASTKFQLQLSLEPYPAPAYRLIYLGSGGFDAEKIYVAYNELGDAAGLDALRRRGVAFVVIKRYNKSDPETVPLLTTLAREGRRVAVFSPYRLGVSEAEEARIDPFLHNTDTRIDNALERPGPTVEIWEIGQALGSGLVRRLALGSGL